MEALIAVGVLVVIALGLLFYAAGPRTPEGNRRKLLAEQKFDFTVGKVSRIFNSK